MLGNKMLNFKYFTSFSFCFLFLSLFLVGWGVGWVSNRKCTVSTVMIHDRLQKVHFAGACVVFSAQKMLQAWQQSG